MPRPRPNCSGSEGKCSTPPVLVCGARSSSGPAMVAGPAMPRSIPMSELTDAQLVVLSAACNRPDRLVLPLPKSLKGGAGIKVVASLIAKGVIEEAEANVTRGDPVWRKTVEGRAMTLLATVDADALLDPGTEAAPMAPQRSTCAKIVKAKRRKAKAPSKAVTAAKRRDGTKQAQ